MSFGYLGLVESLVLLLSLLLFGFVRSFFLGNLGIMGETCTRIFLFLFFKKILVQVFFWETWESWERLAISFGFYFYFYNAQGFFYFYFLKIGFKKSFN